MEECRKQCEAIPEIILCPKGMRKENGICIKQRCSSGTRKNKHTVECEPQHKQTRNECMRTCDKYVKLKETIPLKITKLHKITIAPKLTLTKGTLKKKDPTKMPLVTKVTLKNKKPTTPRSKYIEDLPAPHLLGGADVFQVSFQSVDQFNRYVKITEHTRIECFIQCLFLLGLRDIKEAKKDIQKLKSYKNGVKLATINNVSTANNNYSGSRSFKIGGGVSNTQNHFGDLSNNRIYNTALTDAEVLQNFNATKSRFGL